MTEELYFKDAFTEVDGSINLEVNNLKANCITSNNNNFNLDSEGNLIVNSITTKQTSGSNIDFDMIYPVGSIYFSVNDVNPGTLFGGVWEQIKDRFLLASGDIFKINSMGGNAEHLHGTSDMIACMDPRNMYNNVCFQTRTNNLGYALTGHFYESRDVTEGGGSSKVGLAISGDSDISSNMPPYLTVNIWKRIS